MKPKNPLLIADFYKVSHPHQYPPNTEIVYANWTPRGSKVDNTDHMVWFGMQYYLRYYLQDLFTTQFFSRPLNEVLTEYKDVIEPAVGPLPSYDHIANLHKLGYLPIRIRSLREGTRVPMRVPACTIENTHPNFGWLTNALETNMSMTVWPGCTSATLADRYHAVMSKWNKLTGMPSDFLKYQGHDFSARGMGMEQVCCMSGGAHLTRFVGTDNIPGILFARDYYDAVSSPELASSVPATEHSVMCAYGSVDELETFRRLISDVYPTGYVSIVSDTWDLWRVLDDYLPALKDTIMARPGRVVIRPDSGDPVEIAVETVKRLYKTFGGTKTSTGHILLHPSVGVIYGDSITLARAERMGQRLHEEGFAYQVVLGIGSFTYQYNTRDTFGNAIKSTWVRVNGKEMVIYKDPVTDTGLKKSARGLLSVVPDAQFGLRLVEGTNEAPGNLLQTTFLDGRLHNPITFDEVRRNLVT